jgi:hypothetical protein
MTSKQPDPEPEVPEVELQSMNFERVEQDDLKVVYKASIRQQDADCKLSVTVIRPGDEKELRSLLDGIKAGFVFKALTLEDNTDDGLKSVPELNLNTEIKFEIEVQPHVLDSTFESYVVVEATVAAGEEDEAAQFRSAPGHPPIGGQALVGSVLAGKDHRYNANGGVIRTATATATRDSGTIRSQQALNPHQGLSVGGGSKSEAGGAVWLRGGGKGMRYKITANFHSA